MKIYIVTQGEYSDYHVVATFSDKTEAEYFVNKMNTKFTRYSEDFSLEEHEVLESVEDYNPKKEYLSITYRGDTKEISCSNHYNEYLSEDVGYKSIYFYDEGFYIAFMHVEFTVKNVLGAEKIIMDWVSQIEYELKNTFNGDLMLYKAHYEKNLSR